MSISLYMDVHVPYSITVALRLRGIDVLTSQDDATAMMADPDLLDRATELGRALFAQDKDFTFARGLNGSKVAGDLAASSTPTRLKSPLGSVSRTSSSSQERMSPKT